MLTYIYRIWQAKRAVLPKKCLDQQTPIYESSLLCLISSESGRGEEIWILSRDNKATSVNCSAGFQGNTRALHLQKATKGSFLKLKIPTKSLTIDILFKTFVLSQLKDQLLKAFTSQSDPIASSTPEAPPQFGAWLSSTMQLHPSLKVRLSKLYGGAIP